MAKMHILHIRFSGQLLSLIREEAEHEGLATAQFIREAAMKDAFLKKLQRGELPEADPELIESLERLASSLGIHEADEDFKEASQRSEQGRKTRKMQESGNGSAAEAR